MKLASIGRPEVATGGAAPPSAVIEKMESMGFRVTHLYGPLTEVHGPRRCARGRTTGNALPGVRALMARQGAVMPTLAGMQVGDPETGRPVPRDGATLAR